MSILLAMHPLDFMLRYTVISGIVLAIIGTAICMMAKRITMAKRRQMEVSKQDKFYTGLIVFGVALILIGMVVMVLPVEATFYKY